MYDVDGAVLESTFQPMVELGQNQVGIYERHDLRDTERPLFNQDGWYAYEFKVMVLVEREFNERDHLILFDYLERFYQHQQLEEEDDEEDGP